MISFHDRSEFVFCLVIALLFAGLTAGGCSKAARTETPRDELVNALKGANVEGYVFATKEDDAQLVVSLTNPAVRDFIKFGGGATNVVLRYSSVKDKKANTAKLYKSEVVKTGDKLSLVVTDVATGAVISDDPFPVLQIPPDRKPTFESLDACMEDFNCNRRGALLCEANRTCKDQRFSLICWLNDGSGVSVHGIIKPTRFRCLLTDIIPDFEGVVLSR